jgi:SAM-dependent methyltransferase
MGETRTWRNHKGIFINSVKGYDIIDCERCRFKHIIPLPSGEEMEEYYANQFLEKRPGYIEKHMEDLEWLRTTYSNTYDMIEECTITEPRRIIDIGCSLGLFLAEGRKRGWDTFGIEPSKQAADYAKGLGLEIETEPLSRKNVERFGKFDVVYMREVLEHIPDPVNLLQLAKRLLRPKALLCIVVPNDYNPFQIALRDNLDFPAWWEAPPEHINYFDVSSLKHMVIAQGFEFLTLSTTFPMEIFLFMGDVYVDNKEVGHKCHRRRKEFEINLNRAGMKAFKKELYGSLSELGVGREIVLLARNRIEA